ncbi:MAG: TetR/AcrR family transcriptional regulator [Acetatifactor sp.]|nr:TetR/AcrR family transcriptional regulator [Acetatifactor sp.]
MNDNKTDDKKTDRRIRKTRSLLQQSLIQLMEEKELQDISVKELADLADINRGTFYLHYTDIYDMLHKIEDELFKEFNDILDRNPDKNAQLATHRTVLAEVFSFLERHYDLARVMIGPHGDSAFVNGLKNLVTERLRRLASDEEPRGEYYYSFIVSGYVGVIETWLTSPRPLPAEEMAELCCHMMSLTL